MKTITEEDLYDMAGWSTIRNRTLDRGALIGSAGEVTGIILPPDGRLLTTSQARCLAAQLLLAADLHDAIYDAGYDSGYEVGKTEGRRRVRVKAAQ